MTNRPGTRFGPEADAQGLGAACLGPGMALVLRSFRPSGGRRLWRLPFRLGAQAGCAAGHRAPHWRDPRQEGDAAVDRRRSFRDLSGAQGHGQGSRSDGLRAFRCPSRCRARRRRPHRPRHDVQLCHPGRSDRYRPGHPDRHSHHAMPARRATASRSCLRRRGAFGPRRGSGGGDHGAGRRRPGLPHLRHRLPRSCLCPRNRHARSRRAFVLSSAVDHSGRSRDWISPEWTWSRSRRPTTMPR